MPYRALVSTELAKLFNVLSHPMRICIIEELSKEDLSVGSLKELFGATHAAVSQQLAVLRNCHLISERREGRSVYYHLRNPLLASWIIEGASFVCPDLSEVQEMLNAIENAKSVWPQLSESISSESEPESAAKISKTNQRR